MLISELNVVLVHRVQNVVLHTKDIHMNVSYITNTHTNITHLAH
jgi:hypothetical protein